MKLSEWNRMMQPRGTVEPKAPQFDPPQMAGVECDLCGTEMVVVPTFGTGGKLVKCPKCGHHGTKATNAYY